MNEIDLPPLPYTRLQLSEDDCEPFGEGYGPDDMSEYARQAVLADRAARMEMAASKELRPCPFCGGTNISSGEILDRFDGKWSKQSVCLDCGCSGPKVEFSNIDEATTVRGDEAADEAWNRRHQANGELT